MLDLFNAAGRLAPSSDNFEINPLCPGLSITILTKAWSAALQSHGVCPFLLRKLETFGESTMDWLQWYIQTAEMKFEKEHDHCTESRCARNNIDTLTYKTQHCVPQFPVMKAARSPEGYYSLAVSTMSPNEMTSCTAISHVWLHGLGSSTEIGIPECQVERIWKAVMKLSCSTRDGCFLSYSESPSHLQKSPPFWIDSLCIPEAKDERRYSILLMRKIYKNSGSVLVIDKEIRKCRVGCAIEGLFAAIIMSDWMQRLWTFQEAFLAKSLVFELQDGFFNLDTSLEEEAGSVFYLELPLPAAVIWASLVRQVMTLRRSGAFDVVSMITNALAERSTSKPEDEALAIAGILNIHPGRLIRENGVDIDPKERMKKLYLLMGNVPWEFPFLTGSTYSDKPFRWAPRSFLSQTFSDHGFSSGLGTAEVREDGLVSEYTICKFEQPVRGNKDMSPMEVTIRETGQIMIFFFREQFASDSSSSFPPDETMSFDAVVMDCKNFMPGQYSEALASGIAVNITRFGDSTDIDLTW
ncbi:hypothetical protein BP5796_12494 [Coleophoma crateriformis]|uniref:Heterokaryon incompatibility domain-containing protein n=1 Tax=Coleophoma crateriformis TaxID=565419 RepID=A0A3D8Q7A1_9HELO|nr:hypothetical protein BP5796_12494 [Coleophoma crateriformis]